MCARGGGALAALQTNWDALLKIHSLRKFLMCLIFTKITLLFLLFVLRIAMTTSSVMNLLLFLKGLYRTRTRYSPLLSPFSSPIISLISEYFSWKRNVLRFNFGIDFRPNTVRDFAFEFWRQCLCPLFGTQFASKIWSHCLLKAMTSMFDLPSKFGGKAF